MSDDLIPPDVRSTYEPGKLVVILRNPSLPPLPTGDAGGVVESVDENAGTFVIKDVLPHGPALTSREVAMSDDQHARDVAALEAVVAHATQFTNPNPKIQETLRILHEYADRMVRKKVKRHLFLTPSGLPEGLR